MIVRLAVLLLLITAPFSVHAEPRKRELFENAVDRGLDRLKLNQNPDGSWNAGGVGTLGRRDPSVAALAVMSFLSAGHVPGEGPYGETIIRGIRYVCSQQQANGLFAAQQGMSVMYCHGICTLMAAEVVGLLPDKVEAANLRKRLELAVKLIRHAQSKMANTAGGWRYSPTPTDADLSVTGWQIMALRAAKNVGCDVPADTMEAAVSYIQRSRDRSTGGYRYTVYGNVTVPCTAAAVLSLELCGKNYHKSEDALRAAQYITDQISGRNVVGRAPALRGQHFFYGTYYTAQAMFQIGGDYWKWYREYLHWLLLHPDAHAQQASGAWAPVSGDDAMAGVNYCTAMAILAMTVEYRFLPIYQRNEEPDERQK